MTDSGSESETDMLIQAVQARPFLYNRKDPKYKRIYLKKQAWEHISAKIPTFEDASSAERRWNSLRGKFSTELLRTMGNEYDPLGRPLTKWKYFESLAFLRDHVNPRTGVNQPFPNIPNTSFRSAVNESNHSWSPMPDTYQNNSHALESNADQYYSKILSMLNNGEDSLDNFSNGNAPELISENVPEKVLIPEKVARIERIEAPIHNLPNFSQELTFSNNNNTVVTKTKPQPQIQPQLQPQIHPQIQNNSEFHPRILKRTPARIFGEYLGEMLEGMDEDEGMELQIKIMQLFMEAKKKQIE